MKTPGLINVWGSKIPRLGGRATCKEIRDDAKRQLFTQVDELTNDLRDPYAKRNHKQSLLTWAKSQPLFRDHRNNHFPWTVGRTQAVIDIDEKLDMVKAQTEIDIQRIF